MGKKTERKARPINKDFWDALEECQAECLIYGSRLLDFDDQAGEELFKEALDAILDGSRPWREGSELVHHIKGCMKSIAWNGWVNQSELKLRDLPTDPDPEPIAKQPTVEQQAMRNEKNRVLMRLCNELADGARPGSLEDRFWSVVARGIYDTDDIAEAMGVSRTVIRDLLKEIRPKADALLKKHGYRLESDAESEDFERSHWEDDEQERDDEGEDS